MNILLISNCQTTGLTNCLNYLSNDIHITGIMQSQLENKLPNIQINNFDLIVAPQWINASLDIKKTEKTSFGKVISAFSERKNTKKETRFLHFSPFRFLAYQPDICYLESNEKIYPGKISDYHSKIIYSLFKLGVPQSKVIDFFNADTFRKVGYFNQWQTSVNELNNTYKHIGFNAGDYVPEWSRHGSFMYSINHPSIRCLYDISKVLLDHLNIKFEDPGYYYPPITDNLLEDAVWPVYPDIASRYGFTGSYKFKLPGSTQTITLNQFIESSYQCYDAANETLKPHANSVQSQNHVERILKDMI